MCLTFQKCIIDGIFSWCVQRPAFQKNMETWRMKNQAFVLEVRRVLFYVQNSFSQWGFRIASRHVPSRPPFFHKIILERTNHQPSPSIHYGFTYANTIKSWFIAGIANHDFLAQLPSHLSLQSVRPAKEKHRGSKSWLGVCLAFQCFLGIISYPKLSKSTGLQQTISMLFGFWKD